MHTHAQQSSQALSQESKKAMNPSSRIVPKPLTPKTLKVDGKTIEYRTPYRTLNFLHPTCKHTVYEQVQTFLQPASLNPKNGAGGL